MATKYIKTEAGQREITEKTHALARAQRTLLVLTDGTKDREQLLALVRGATPEDLAALVQTGLVAEVQGSSGSTRTPSSSSASAATAPAVATPADAPADPASAEGAVVEFKELYDGLMNLVRSQLGLVKAFKYTLEVEKAGTVAELREVARRFATEVEATKGESSAKMVRRALGLTD